MAEIGVALASEDWGPRELVTLARSAEEAGFEYAFISDHYHPWVDAQGSSPFVWSVIGGIAEATENLSLTTGVTCPLIRIHPAIVAQAAATVACMMPGRFTLGVGTGENLNEHIVGTGWPTYRTRQAMLAEAVAIIRRLWKGETCSYDGRYFQLDNARLYTLPSQLPPLVIAAGGPKAAEFAGRDGDGLINFAPDKSITDAFTLAGGQDKPRY